MLRVVDHALPLGGVALIVLGAMGWPVAMPLGWMALGLAFFAWVAKADGIPVPRLGLSRGRVVAPRSGSGRVPSVRAPRAGKLRPASLARAGAQGRRDLSAVGRQATRRSGSLTR